MARAERSPFIKCTEMRMDIDCLQPLRGALGRLGLLTLFTTQFTVFTYIQLTSLFVPFAGTGICWAHKIAL